MILMYVFYLYLDYECIPSTFYIVTVITRNLIDCTSKVCKDALHH